MEAQNAEGRADFIHKIKLAAKESEETQYWLMLCNYSPLYPNAYGELNKLQEINKILGKIIYTFNQNAKK